MRANDRLTVRESRSIIQTQRLDDVPVFVAFPGDGTGRLSGDSLLLRHGGFVMDRLLFAGLVSLGMAASAHAFQSSHHHGHGSYPQVYGPTGHLYGPTQAHYQYERQYGHPWHGYGGVPYSGNYGGTTFFGSSSSGVYGFARLGLPAYGYNYGYSGISAYTPFGGLNFGIGTPGVYSAYPYSGPVYSWFPLAPTSLQPVWNAPNPLDPAAGAGQPANGAAPAPQPVKPPPQVINPLVKASSPEAKVKSLRLQMQGDEWFAKQNYLQAYARYKQAVSEAADVAAPRFRMGLVLAAMGHFDLAVTEIKRGLALDAKWPATGEQLEQLFGANNVIAREGVLQRVAAWVREDVRDPNRLFLLGVFLHFNGEGDKARTFFETADQLAGSPAHVRAFLFPVAAAVQPAGFAAPVGPPVPMPPDAGDAAKPQALPDAKPAAVPVQPNNGGLVGPKLFVPGENAKPASGPRVVDFPPAGNRP